MVAPRLVASWCIPEKGSYDFSIAVGELRVAVVVAEGLAVDVEL